MNRTFDLNCGFLVPITDIDDFIVHTFSLKFEGMLTEFRKSIHAN